MKDEIREILSDPARKRDIMKKIDGSVEQIYKDLAENSECDLGINIKLSGISLLRYRVLKVFICDTLGKSEEEFHSYLFERGIERQIERLGELRNQVLKETGISTE